MPNFNEDPNAFGPTVQGDLRGEHVMQTSPAHPAAPSRRQLAQHVSAATQAFEEESARAMEETRAHFALMNEARVRFAKASLYEQILEGAVFEGSTDPVTAEVNAEFREFAQEKMCALLGIQNESTKKGSKLTDEQIEVLAMMANSILERAGKTPAPVSSEKPQPQKVGRLATVKRPVLVNRATPPRPPMPPAPVTPRQQVQMQQEQNHQQQAPQQLDLPLNQPNIQAMPTKDGGVYVRNVGISQVLPPRPASPVAASNPRPLPMPSPAEQVSIAAAQGEAAAQGSGVVQKILAVTSHGQQ